MHHDTHFLFHDLCDLKPFNSIGQACNRIPPILTILHSTEFTPLDHSTPHKVRMSQKTGGGQQTFQQRRELYLPGQSHQNSDGPLRIILTYSEPTQDLQFEPKPQRLTHTSVLHGS